MRVFHQNEGCLPCPILPRVMEEGESKKAALILMKNSHFDRTLRYIVMKLLFSAVLFCIYLPTAVVGYTFLGDCIQPNMLDSLLDDSAVKLAASVIITLHLYTAAPIAMSAPTLWMEEILNIPSSTVVSYQIESFSSK